MDAKLAMIIENNIRQEAVENSFANILKKPDIYIHSISMCMYVCLYVCIYQCVCVCPQVDDSIQSH